MPLEMRSTPAVTSLLLMTENNQRADYLALHAGMLRAEIVSLLARHPEEQSEGVEDLLSGLKGLTGTPKIVGGRNCTDDSLLAMPFTKSNETGLRYLATKERLLAAHMAAQGFDVVFEHGQSLVNRLRAKSAA